MRSRPIIFADIMSPLYKSRIAQVPHLIVDHNCAIARIFFLVIFWLASEMKGYAQADRLIILD